MSLKREVFDLLRIGCTRQDIYKRYGKLKTIQTYISDYSSHVNNSRKTRKDNASLKCNNVEKIREKSVMNKLKIGDTVTVRAPENYGNINPNYIKKQGTLIQKTKHLCIINIGNYVEAFKWEDVLN